MGKQSAEHKKKMIAPVAVTVLFLAYLIFYGVMLFTTTDGSPLLILAAVPLAALGIGMVCTLRSRIKEIKGGEEDDLSNY